MLSTAEWIKAYGLTWEDRDDQGPAMSFTQGAIYRSRPLHRPLRARLGR